MVYQMNTKIKLAGYTMSELEEIYRRDLFDHYLPYLNKHVFDQEYGGFMCHTNRCGTQTSNNKRTWYDGRGVWVYCYLYRYFEKN